MLRKQLYEEIHSQFESRLREAKREKSQLEEELETASEKWRGERRRLNTEIDRLESKLVEARDTRKKTPDAKLGKPADIQDITRIQAAADERIAKATLGFESERGKLQAEIMRLQSGIADLIEQSNNPLRTSHVEKERFETRLDEALKGRRLAEQALLAGKAEWEQEKLKLLGELVKLRSAPSQDKVKTREFEEKLAQLEKKLQEAVRSREELAADLDKAKLQLKTRQSDLDQFDAVSLQLERSHKERANLEKQLQEATKQAQAKVSMSGELQELTAQLERSQSERANLEKQLREIGKQAQAKQSFSNELQEMATQLERSQKERVNLERQLRDASRSQEKLERELDKVRQSPLVMKEAQFAEIERLKEELKSARVEVRSSAALLDEIRATTSKERAVLEKQLREAHSQQERLSRELDRIQHSRPSKDGDSAELARLKQEFEKANAEARLATSTARQHHAEELARLNEQLNEARHRLQQLESAAPESQQPVNSEIVQQLRNQYDERLQEMIHEKTQLSDELRSVTSLLEGERMKLAADGAKKASGADSFDQSSINGEVERIQEMIAGIARLIDDPETELSTVIRKNVERAELDAYLKGILFSIGKGKGL